MFKLIKAASLLLTLTAMVFFCFPKNAYETIASEMDIKRVTIVDDGTQRITTNADTVEALFEEQGITLYAKDWCTPPLSSPLMPDMQIQIMRGYYVTVSIDGEEERRKVSVKDTAETLIVELQDEYGMALLYEGDPEIPLQENDYLALLTCVTETITTTLEIPYATKVIETTGMLMGREHVLQAGIPGERNLVTALVYVGGVVQHTETIADTVITEPVPAIIERGIGGTLGTTTDVTSPSFRYVSKMTMSATAYTAGYESTGKRPGDKGYGITYTGAQVEPGIVSVDPRVIPLGTRLYVEGYGYSLAADIGSAIVGNRIDLFYHSLTDALNFGRRNLTVYILE